MKRKMLLTTLALLAVGLVHGATITVTQPSGGTVTMGSPVQIIWTAVDVVSNVRIVLRRPGGALVGTLATGLPASPGLYDWTVAAPAVVGETYKVHVRAVDGSAEGESAPFSVSGSGVNPPSLSLDSPHGGESWEIGSTQPITWTALNITENCRLILLKNEQIQGTIRDSFAPGQGSGSWNWQVGNYQGGPALTGSGYKVRIQTLSGPMIYSAQSANPFTIIPKPIIIAPLRKIEVMAILLRPDLAVCLAWGGKRPLIWQKRNVTVRVKNIGKAAAPATTCNLYVEGHGTRSISVPGLTINQEVSFNYEFSWPTVGHKTVRATVDPAGQVQEGNENNNEISKSIKVILPHENKYVTKTDICSDQN